MSSSQDPSSPSKLKPSSRASKKRSSAATPDALPLATPATVTDPTPSSAPESAVADAPAPAPDPTPASEPAADDARGSKKTKKTPFMSASIPDLSVGDVRKCLNEIRKLGAAATVSHTLANGWTAGEFALKYLLGNAPASGKDS